MNEFSDLKLLCVFCFDTLLNYLNKKNLEVLPKLPESFSEKSYPLFVTWTKDKKLRGCIGTFESQDLNTNLPKFTIVSALKDYRFSPISSEEIPLLKCGVSLLINFEKVNDPLNWDVGIHGIIIEFTYSGKDYRGTYLPEVAKDQNWSQKESLKNLIYKAGFKESLDKVFDLISTTRYQSIKTDLHFDEYKVMKIKSN